MSGLREALEKLVDDFDGKPHGGAVAYTRATRILREMLADHPVEPPEVCSCRTIAPSGWDRVVNVTDPGCVIHGDEALGAMRKWYADQGLPGPDEAKS